MALAVLLAALSASAGAAPAGEARKLEAARAETGLDPKSPAWLPAGYALKEVEVLPYHGKKIIHLLYSDGKSALSLFQLPPRTHLDFGAKDREKFRFGPVKGTLGSSEQGKVLGWSVKGARLVLVGALEPEVLGRIAQSVR